MPAAIPVLGRTALWLPLVQRIAAPYALPAALELGLIAHESHGDYQAQDPDANGTVDAGLTQINSGPAPGHPHWAEYGLTQNPAAPAANVAAGSRILAADVQRYGDVRQALLAYNAGTPADGLRYAPRYPGDVLAYARQLQAGPVVAAWPTGGGWTATGGAWRAPAPSPGATAYIVVTAIAPSDATEHYAGQRWAALQQAAAVTVRVGGQTLMANTSASAPFDLQTAMPPDSFYWWVGIPIAPGETTRAGVTALWNRPPSGAAAHAAVLRAGTSLVLRTLARG